MYGLGLTELGWAEQMCVCVCVLFIINESRGLCLLPQIINYILHLLQNRM